MAGEALVETLTLDIAPALSALEPIGTAFDQIISSFSTGLADGISTALGNISGLDTTGITTAVEGALTDATATPIPIEGDVSGLDASLADALDQPRDVPLTGDPTALVTAITDATQTPQDVPLSADASGLTTAITDATSATQDVPLSADASELLTVIGAATSDTQTVPVTADTTAAKNEIDALSGETIDIPVTTDTTEAQASFDQLGTSATSATSSVSGLEGAAQGVSAATGLASGSTEGLTSAVSALSPEVAAAGVGIVAFGGFIADAAKSAADGEAQNKRFLATFGDLADQVQHVNVGGLTADFATLGRESGTTVTNLQAVATRIGQLGQSSGASGAQIVTTTDNLVALGSVLSVQNPRLGDAATVTDALTGAFARGGRALAPYGIALSAAQINTEALRETGKSTAADLTIFEKATAGANLAVAQFGDTLGTKFQEGAQNAQVQFRALKTSIEETISTVGGPLLQPLVTTLTDVLPVAQQVGIALGQLAQAVLPIVADLAPALIPVAGAIGLVADGIGGLGGVISALPTPVLIGGLLLVGPAAIAAATGVDVFGIALDAALGPVGIILGGLALIGTAFDIFGSKGPSAADASKAIGDALFGTSVSAGTLSGQLASLDTNLDTFAGKLLSTQGPLGAFAPAFDAFGGGANGLSAALSSSDASFQTYKQNLADAASAAGLGKVGIDLLTQGLDQQRQALIANENEQISNLLSTNKVNQSQIDAAKASVIAKEGYLDLAAVLKILSGEADAVDAANQKIALSNAVASGAVKGAVAEFQAGGESAAVFAGNLEALGLSTADAKKFSDDLAASQQKQADATVLATPAVQQLVAAFAAGNISSSQFEGSLVSLGVSVTGTTTTLTAISNAVDAFVNSAAKLAPSIDSALKTVEQDQTSAQKTSDQAVAALGKTTESNADAVTKAWEKIGAAQEQGGKKGATAVASAIAQFGQVQKDSKAKLDDATQAVDVANLKLIAAADPQRVIDALNKGLTDVTNFEANLAKIVKDGGIQLAESLASQGPAIAGAQAAAFAVDPGGVKISEKLIGQTQSATSKYTEFLNTTFGPEVAAQLEAQSGIAAAGFKPDLAGQAATAMDGARTSIITLTPGVTAAGSQAGADVSTGFAQTLTIGDVTGQAVLGAQTSLVRLSPALAGVAKSAGTTTTESFGGALDPSGQLSQKFQDGVNTILSAEASLIPAAAGIGHSIGVAFSDGIGQGIIDATPAITAAATSAANTAASATRHAFKISSPSQVGVDIGGQFIAGIAVGLSDTTPLTDAGARAATATADAFDHLTTGLALAPVVIPVTADTTSARTTIDQFATQTAAPTTIDVDANVTPATDTVARLADRIATDTPVITVRADTALAATDLGTLTQLASRPVVAPVTLDTSAVGTEAATISAALPAAISVPVTVDTTAIPAELAPAAQAIRALGDTAPVIRPNVDTTTADRALDGLARPRSVPLAVTPDLLTVPVTADTSALTDALTTFPTPTITPILDTGTATRALNTLAAPVTVSISADTDPATLALTQFDAGARSTTTAVTITADTTVARTALDTLTTDRPTVDITADTTAGTTAIRALESVAADTHAVVPVTANIDAATSALDAIAPVPVTLPVIADATDALSKIDEIVKHAHDAHVTITTTTPTPVPAPPVVAPLTSTSFGSLADVDAAIAKLEAEQAAEAKVAAAFAASQQALQSFVSSAVGALPTAATAVQAYGSAVSTALANVTKAQDAASKATQKLTDDTSKYTGALIIAQNQLAADERAQLSQRQIFLDQAKVDKAQHDLTVASLLDTKAVQDTAAGVSASQAALNAATNPDAFIRQITANTKNAQQFESDITKLVNEKFPLLAQQLAALGPDTARKLADALAGSPAKAKLAEAALEQSAAFAKQFTDTLTKEFTSKTDAATAAGTTVGAAIGKGTTDALLAAGDHMFEALTGQFAHQSLSLPVNLQTPQLSIPAVGGIAVPPGSPGSTSASSLALDLTILLPSGQTVKVPSFTAIIPPAAPNGMARKVTAQLQAVGT